MLEYTALVDAPVQRFTGIVTGSEPDDDDMTITVTTPTAQVAAPVTEVPALLVAAVPEPPVAAEPLQLIEPIQPIQPPVWPAPERPIPHALVPRSEPARPPSLAPALLAVAAAGITAMWWLRRDHRASH